MTDWTQEEDEAFNEVEKHSNLGKQILREIAGQPYYFDARGESLQHVMEAGLEGSLFVSQSQRNQVLEEVAKEFDKMTSLGDTAASFARYVRDMK